MLRWLLTSWVHWWIELTAYIRAHSDIPFHGWLLWSYTAPVKATQIIAHRGLWCRIGEYWWPMPLNWIEQTQDGETIPHNFTWPTWAYGETRYAMLFPSNDPTFDASTSPIWAITAPFPPFWTLVCEEPWSIGLYPWIPEPTEWDQVIFEPWSEFFPWQLVIAETWNVGLEPWRPEPTEWDLVIAETWTT